MKIARKVTGRSGIAAFTNGFHGMTLGRSPRQPMRPNERAPTSACLNVVRLPFDGYHGKHVDTIALIEKMLEDPGSGVDAPAAFLVETVQGEGGLHTASNEWLRRLAALAKRNGALLIVDDIQAGCGRTGKFVSFEDAGIEPDIVCLSKSIGGIGLPVALVLIKPTYDQWLPGSIMDVPGSTIWLSSPVPRRSISGATASSRNRYMPRHPLLATVWRILSIATSTAKETCAAEA